MAARLLKSILYRWYSASQKHQPGGFTLIELLVGTLLAAIVVTGLLDLVLQLLQANQQESAQTETQRDMQTALDFISSELREAIYVYGGNCLQGQTTPTWCPGIVNSVNAPASSIPILAFWKLEPLPTQFYQTGGACTISPIPSNCNSGRTYTLVIYFLSKNNLLATWPGKARIMRYALTQYNAAGTLNTNYIDPNQTSVGFVNWPYKVSGLTQTNLLANPLNSDSTNTAVLVDFVDDTARPTVGDNSNDSIICPTSDYVVSPKITTLNNYVTPTSLFSTTNTNIRSFYACVRGGTSYNQDTFVFLRGNASGRPGISNDSFLPTLQTQVLSHGIINDIPAVLQ